MTNESCGCPGAASALPEIACSLEAGALPARVEEWRALLRTSAGRAKIGGGVRVTFPRSADVAAIAYLAVRELACCAFFEFALHLSRDGVALDVRAPEDALPIVEALFE